MYANLCTHIVEFTTCITNVEMLRTLVTSFALVQYIKYTFHPLRNIITLKSGLNSSLQTRILPRYSTSHVKVYAKRKKERKKKNPVLSTPVEIFNYIQMTAPNLGAPRAYKTEPHLG